MVGKVVTLTLALAVTFLLLSSVRAGETNTHEWPLQLDRPQIEVAEMAVLMDITGIGDLAERWARC